jgi:hypothetical protein
VASPAFAQSASPLTREGLPDARVQVGVVVPLGSAGSKAERAPRLEAWSEHGPTRAATQAPLRFDPAIPAKQMRLGVTLTKAPQMMLNGREVPRGKDGKPIGTWGWVAIGTVAVLVAGGVLLVDAIRDMNN